MNKKKLASKRNRHTGKINSFKRFILNRPGVVKRFSDNTDYKICYELNTFVRLN